MGIPKISAREEEVLFAMADGLLDREIAAELFISIHTVKTHIKNIHNSLGSRSKAHAVALAYHYGILIPRQQN